MAGTQYTPACPQLVLCSGPGIRSGLKSVEPTAHEDILPTILSLAGISLPSDLDGQPLPLEIKDKHHLATHYKQPKFKFDQ